MRYQILLGALLTIVCAEAQEPVITSWLQNNTETGSYYVTGNSTAIDNGILYNCQLIEYSDNYVYVHTHGIPAYATGPFQDGNPSQAQDQDAIYRFTRFPEQETGTQQGTTPGNIGVFINGVSLFDYRDGVAWNPLTNAICGGPGNPPCPGGMGAVQDWNRDAIPAEMPGFDCSKAHPAMGNYHHHQNPSAFKLDLEVVSDICNLYDADGLYAIDDEVHSPLIGFAYDGFPIYGAYGYANADGSGGISRIKSGYELGTTPDRSTFPDGSASVQGPDFVDYFRGYFREDYIFVEHPGEEDYLDEHNGRFCVTPEYPEGTYAYFATVDENWNSAYPYVVGPSFYGVYDNASVNNVNEETTVYSPNSLDEQTLDGLSFTVFPNPSADLVAVQANGLVDQDLQIIVTDMLGQLVEQAQIKAGSTIWYLDTRTLYAGQYIIQITKGDSSVVHKVLVD